MAAQKVDKVKLQTFLMRSVSKYKRYLFIKFKRDNFFEENVFKKHRSTSSNLNKLSDALFLINISLKYFILIASNAYS